MKQIYKSISIAISMTCLIAMTFSGCSASGPLFVRESIIPEGKGILYIYQEPRTGPIAITSSVYIYDKPTVVIQDGGYFAYFAYPGKTKVSASQGRISSVVVDVKEGEECYVRCKYTFGKISEFGGNAQIHLEVIPVSVGKLEITQCRKLTN